MGDAQNTTFVYEYEDVDQDDLNNIAVTVGMLLENELEPDSISSKWFDGSNNITSLIKGRHPPFNRTKFREEKDPGWNAPTYDGKFNCEARVEVVPRGNKIYLDVETEVINRQGAFASNYHREIANKASDLYEDAKDIVL